ncbi:hypothetical protein NLI96_g3568 [Meripilus lineatus]|uniref:Uncharacterized protein n=1 Tax=Meripilus lineatus TaxID=2056292 RepID=A0AAD5V6M6_9APHY|nr:hypothetical protein NLI96_g3568 [Physisporinus lineatus]
MNPTNEHLVLVHHFALSDSSLPSTAALLEEGTKLVQGSINADKWRNAVPVAARFSIDIRRCYIYNAPLPTVAVSNWKSEQLLEWSRDSITVLPHEIFRTEDLDEFESTDLTFIGAKATPREKCATVKGPLPPIPPTRRRTRTSRSRSQSPPRKRQRLENASLYRLIPLPHYHGIIGNETTVSHSGQQADDFFHRSSPRVLRSQGARNVSQLLDDPYARFAWVIPIRGTPPWEDCTGAVIACVSDSLSSLPTPPTSKDRDISGAPYIVWTADSVRSLWDFLLKVREVNSLGLLALSFHAAPIASRLPTAAGPRNQPPQVATPYGPTHNCDNTSVSSVDHIKIYHDSQYTIAVRNVLHAWAFKYSEKPTRGRQGEVPDRPEDVGNLTKKIRIFRGARLVLLDEIDEGILTC